MLENLHLIVNQRKLWHKSALNALYCMITASYHLQLYDESCTIIRQSWRISRKVTIWSFKIGIIVHHKYFVDKSYDESEEIFNYRNYPDDKSCSFILYTVWCNHAAIRDLSYDFTWFVVGLFYKWLQIKFNSSIMMKMPRLMPIRQFPHSSVTIFNHPLWGTGP